MKKWRDLDVHEKSSVAIVVIYLLWMIGYTIYICRDYIAPALEAIGGKFKKLASKFKRKKNFTEVDL